MSRERPKIFVSHFEEPFKEFDHTEVKRGEAKLFDDGDNIWRAVPLDTMLEFPVVSDMPREFITHLGSLEHAQVLEELRIYIEKQFAELRSFGIRQDAKVIYTDAHITYPPSTERQIPPELQEFTKHKDCLLIVAPKVKEIPLKYLNQPERQAYCERAIKLYESLLAYYRSRKASATPLLWDTADLRQYVYGLNPSGDQEFVLVDADPKIAVTSSSKCLFLGDAISSIEKIMSSATYGTAGYRTLGQLASQFGQELAVQKLKRD